MRKRTVLIRKTVASNTMPLFLTFRCKIDSDSGCYQELRELSVYRKFGTFTVTTEDAKVYLYSFSTRRRVYKFQDIKVNLYL